MGNGQSSATGGIVVLMSEFQKIQVNPGEDATITVGGGCTWGPVYQAANDAGYVSTGGHDLGSDRARRCESGSHVPTASWKNSRRARNMVERARLSGRSRAVEKVVVESGMDGSAALGMERCIHGLQRNFDVCRLQPHR